MSSLLISQSLGSSDLVSNDDKYRSFLIFRYSTSLLKFSFGFFHPFNMNRVHKKHKATWVSGIGLPHGLSFSCSILEVKSDFQHFPKLPCFSHGKAFGRYNIYRFIQLQSLGGDKGWDPRSIAPSTRYWGGLPGPALPPVSLNYWLTFKAGTFWLEERHLCVRWVRIPIKYSTVKFDV